MARVIRLAVGALVVVAAVAAAWVLSRDDGGAPAETVAATTATAEPAAVTATSTATTPAATTTAPAVDPDLPIGDPRRLPPPAPGELTGVLITGTGLCAPGIVDLAAPATPAPVAMSAPGCSIRTSSSGRWLATSTRPDPEGQPLVVLDTRTGRTRTARREDGAVGTGPPAVSNVGAVATCYVFAGVVVDTPRRSRRVPGRCTRVALGNRIAVLARDRRTLLDAATSRRVLELGRAVRGELPVLAPSRSGALVAALAFDVDQAFSYLTVYDGRTGEVRQPRRRLTNAVRIRDVHLADDGRALALRSDVGWELFNLATGDRLRLIGQFPITSAAVSPDGSRFVAATAAALVFVDVATLAPRQAIPAEVQSVAWLEQSPTRRG